MRPKDPFPGLPALPATLNPYPYALNNPVNLPDGTSVANVYDPDGRRVQQTIGAQTTDYLWDETSLYGDVIYETAGAGGTDDA